ncbi:hypothetical protein SRHO_G00286140 [Serrasalmus rhombeus]
MLLRRMVYKLRCFISLPIEVGYGVPCFGLILTPPYSTSTVQPSTDADLRDEKQDESLSLTEEKVHEQEAHCLSEKRKASSKEPRWHLVKCALPLLQQELLVPFCQWLQLTVTKKIQRQTQKQLLHLKHLQVQSW